MKENNLYERFLNFVEVTDRTGAGLAKTITATRVGIDVINMRDQGYNSVVIQ